MSMLEEIGFRKTRKVYWREIKAVILKMQKFIFIGFICFFSFSITACKFNYMEPDEIHNFLEEIVSDIGSYQLTDDEDLFGTRKQGSDFYSGIYTADCNSSTGRDVIFGGGSMEERELNCHGYIITKSGEATVRIRMNEEVIELKTDENGYFCTFLNLSSGGNYIMIDYDDFIGTVEIECEEISSETEEQWSET